MNSTHPTAEELDRYRRRAAPPAETLAVDAHVAACDRCHRQIRADVNAVTLAAEPEERHLHFDELEAVVDGCAGAEVRLHAESCAPCGSEVADVRQMREAMERDRPAARRPLWWAAAAAIAIVLVAGAWMWMRRSQSAPLPAPPVVRTEPTPEAAPRPEKIVLQRPAVLQSLIHEESVLRGATEAAPLELHRPVGTVVLEDRPRFRWSPLRGAKSYAIAVADAETGSVAASGATADTTWRATTPLRRGRTYMWQVTAQTDERALVSPAPSEPPALFRVGAAAELSPQGSPLERGVALAEIGALDDAERELERAVAAGDPRAADVLAQVRSWRQRALPTTTNGAQ